MRLVLIILAACGSPSIAPDASNPHDASHAPSDAPADAAIDAPPAPDLSCSGQPPPPTAPDPLALDGKVFVVDHYQLAPFAGATVVTHRRSDDGVLATSTVTAADGTYAMSAATGGNALAAYFTVAAEGYLPVRIDPGDPLTDGYFGLAFVASADEIARWYADAGVTANDSALISIAVDCNHQVVADSTLAVLPTARVTYYDTMKWNPALTASANGYSLVTNAAASEAVTAAWHGQAFPAHTAIAPTHTLSLVVTTPHS
jgi:hypothetical protein